MFVRVVSFSFSSFYSRYCFSKGYRKSVIFTINHEYEQLARTTWHATLSRQQQQQQKNVDKNGHDLILNKINSVKNRWHRY